MSKPTERIKAFLNWMCMDELAYVSRITELERKVQSLEVSAKYKDKEIERLEKWLNQAYAENDKLEDVTRKLRFRLSEQGRLMANRPVKLP